MSWLSILQLAMTLLSQALSAFAQGAKKEDAHSVTLAPEHQVVVAHLANQQ